MSSPGISCNTDRLRLLLADQLPEQQQREIADHLSECDSCRGLLESFAGDKGWWTEVQSCLRTHAQDSHASDDSALAIDSLESHESFAADFVVDFLEPSDEP